MPPAGCGSTPLLAICRTSRWTTSTRQAGVLPEHLWVMRHIRIDVEKPPVDDDHVELSTWCSGTASVAAGRRLSLVGDRGGRVEVDSVWIHLGPDARPARLVGFDMYEQAADGRVVSTKLELAAPSGGARTPPLAAPEDRHRPARAREQRRVLACGRGRALRPGPGRGTAVPCAARASARARSRR